MQNRFLRHVTGGIAGVVLLLCGLSLKDPPALATPLEQEACVLASLRNQAASLQSLSGEFSQETAIPMFAKPMLSTGSIRYKKPDFLAWEYTAPLQEGFVLAGKQGFRWEEQREQRSPFSTDQDPVASFVGQELLAWIHFDLETIGSRYFVQRVGEQPLTLFLTPKDEGAKAVLASLRLVFDGRGIAQSVTLSEAKGGVTVIRFHNMTVNAPLDDAYFR